MTTPSKRLSIALAASIALNLFGAGFLVSRLLHHRHASMLAPMLAPNDEQDRGNPFMGPRGLLGSGAEPRLLPHVREVMRAHGEGLRQDRAARRERRRAVEDALRAEPFDGAALSQALGSLRQSTLAAQERMHTALVELAKKLPAEDRQKLARHGSHGRGGPGHRGRMPMHHDGGLDR